VVAGVVVGAATGAGAVVVGGATAGADVVGVVARAGAAPVMVLGVGFARTALEDRTDEERRGLRAVNAVIATVEARQMARTRTGRRPKNLRVAPAVTPSSGPLADSRWGGGEDEEGFSTMC